MPKNTHHIQSLENNVLYRTELKRRGEMAHGKPMPCLSIIHGSAIPFDLAGLKVTHHLLLIRIVTYW